MDEAVLATVGTAEETETTREKYEVARHFYRKASDKMPRRTLGRLKESLPVKTAEVTWSLKDGNFTQMDTKMDKMVYKQWYTQYKNTRKIYLYKNFIHMNAQKCLKMETTSSHLKIKTPC